jgi:hypothetical protein
MPPSWKRFATIWQTVTSPLLPSKPISVIWRASKRAQTQGQEFSPAAIAHVSPLARRHVIVNGTYDFSPSQNHHADEGLCV